MSIVECETENSHTVGTRYKICRTYFRVTGQSSDSQHGHRNSNENSNNIPKTTTECRAIYLKKFQNYDSLFEILSVWAYFMKCFWLDFQFIFL